MWYVFSTLLLLSTTAFAGEWLCEDEASQRSGNTIKACGIGEGYNEDAARWYALRNARFEFQSICQLSSDCRNAQNIIVSPGRTTCSKTKNGDYHCTRLINFSIED